MEVTIVGLVDGIMEELSNWSSEKGFKFSVTFDLEIEYLAKNTFIIAQTR